MTTSPTTGAREPAASWAGRPMVARALRVAVVVLPVLASWGVTRALAGVYWHPPGPLGIVAWAVQMLVVGTAVVLLTGRLTRRLLPLAALFNLTLAFPDEAPSRFRVALRSGTIRNLEAQVADVRANGLGDTQAEAAARVIELVGALSRHERLTRGHTERVRAYSDMIAVQMGLPAEDREKLRWAAMLHDIGKLAVPAEILNKPGRPTEEEWAILSSHPAIGGELLEPLADWLGPWRLAASEHHERWDGNGYPRKLAGTEISLAGRIVAVADAYDVITSARTYKKPMSAVAARQELVRCSGTQFDPAVVRAFLAVSLGNRGTRVGALGWIAELARSLATTAMQGAGSAGTIVAATAMASAGAVGVVAPAAVPEPFLAATPAIVVDQAAPTTGAPAETVAAARATTRPAALAEGDDAGAVRQVAAVAIPDAPGPAAVPTSAPVTAASPATSVASPTTTQPPVATTTTTRPSTAAPTTTGAPTTTTPPLALRAPQPADDRVRVTAGSTVVIDVLANDTDADGDLDPSTLTITDVAVRGEAVVENGVIVFTAAVRGRLDGQVVYEVCDRTGLCATASVSVVKR